MENNENTRELMRTIDRLVAERDAAERRAEKAEGLLMAERAQLFALANPNAQHPPVDVLRVCPGDGWAAVVRRDLETAARRQAAAERRESELGLQVVAQAARLRLATETIEAMRAFDHARTDVALAAWDAVPGDVSTKGTPFDEAGTTNPDKVTP